METVDFKDGIEQIQKIEEKVVMFRTHDDVVRTRGNLYEAARKWWRVSVSRALEAEYVFAVIDDVVREVYQITGWHEEKDNGTAFPPFKGVRKVFDMRTDTVLNSVREKYKDKMLPVSHCKWGQNPVHYIHFDK
ncbi:MAG: hypothetical protein K2M99_07485 [Treponemataceae bacterium]|nr:hypothetical protein [Treponema sp.]MBD5442144.1 hypothetical protein [Treponema sp.]MDE7383708.1 hypothetical protein [Treponemataceae bacterium]